MKKFCLLFLLMALSIFLVAMDYPPSGSDLSNYRCPDGIISKGDQPRDVLDKCGEPLRTGTLPNREHDIWVYRFGDANFIYYIGFLNDRIQRIYAVNCIKDDPNCDLQD